MYKYQNISELDQTITTTGNINPRIVEAGATTESDVAIENPNFKYLGTAENEQTQPEAEQLENNETNKEIN